MVIRLIKSLKFRVRKYLIKLKIFYSKLSKNAICVNDIQINLARLGLKKGDKIIVHSSMSKIGILKNGPFTFVQALKEFIGKDGTIIMPTHSTHNSYQFLSNNKTFFDVVNTPSVTGAITEAFRKSTDVIRSIHPTHSVAAWGKDAEFYVKGHEKSNYPFDENSPYPKIIKNNFKTLAIGVNLNSTTIVRAADDLFPEYPFSPYDNKLFKKKCIDYNNNIIFVETYSHKNNIKAIRDNMLLFPYVKDFITQDKLFNAETMLFSSAKMYSAIVELAKKRIITYKIEI